MELSSGNKILVKVIVENDKVVEQSVKNLITNNEYKCQGYLFGISYKANNKMFSKLHFFNSNDMKVVESDENCLIFEHTEEGIDWQVKVLYEADDNAGVVRKFLEIHCSNPNVFIDYIDLDSFDCSYARFKWTIPMPEKRVYTPCYITTEGQPFYVEDMFFGAEFPVADNRIENNISHAKYHIGRLFKDIANDGIYTTVSFVLGSGIGARFDKMRASFFQYVSTFARPAKFRVQYNSWYDNMLDINSVKIEDSFTSVAEGFRQAGYRPLDCYVVDDGWIDYKSPTFWEFDKHKFSDEFNIEKELTKSLGSKFGVWFGPRGGYTNQTIKYAHLLEKIGYHTCKQSMDICTADPKYIHDLCSKMAKFCEDYNVTYFKIDGFAITPCHSKNHGHPQGKGDGLYFYTFLWEEWIKGFELIRKTCPDVFLNITSYAHCSPWFLKWCDAVWINNSSDMGYEGSGSNLNQCLCYRDGRYKDFFENRQLQFPQAYIYNHEPCYAERNYNPPLPNPSHKTVVYTYEEFEEYMYMCMMRGTGFIELYFSPSMFDEKRWKIAAKVLTWAEKNFDIIKNAQFFGATPKDGGIYGYYAFDGEKKAIMSIRNSSDKELSYELNNLERCFIKSGYNIELYYPNKGDKKHINEDEKYKITLKPYESRIYYINLD